MQYHGYFEYKCTYNYITVTAMKFCWSSCPQNRQKVIKCNALQKQCLASSEHTMPSCAYVPTVIQCLLMVTVLTIKWSAMLCYSMFNSKQFIYCSTILQVHTLTSSLNQMFAAHSQSKSGIPSPPVDNVWAMMIDWRISRGNENCSVLCYVRWYTHTHTHTSSS